MCTVANMAPLKGCGIFIDSPAINMSLLRSEEKIDLQQDVICCHTNNQRNATGSKTNCEANVLLDHIGALLVDVVLQESSK
jgi:hypothetical protein